RKKLPSAHDPFKTKVTVVLDPPMQLLSAKKVQHSRVYFHDLPVRRPENIHLIGSKSVTRLLVRPRSRLSPRRAIHRRQYIINSRIFDRMDMITDNIFTVRRPGQLPVRLTLSAITGKSKRIAHTPG